MVRSGKGGLVARHGVGAVTVPAIEAAAALLLLLQAGAPSSPQPAANAERALAGEDSGRRGLSSRAQRLLGIAAELVALTGEATLAKGLARLRDAGRWPPTHLERAWRELDAASRLLRHLGEGERALQEALCWFDCGGDAGSSEPAFTTAGLDVDSPAEGSQAARDFEDQEGSDLTELQGFGEKDTDASRAAMGTVAGASAAGGVSAAMAAGASAAVVVAEIPAVAVDVLAAHMGAECDATEADDDVFHEAEEADAEATLGESWAEFAVDARDFPTPRGAMVGAAGEAPPEADDGRDGGRVVSQASVQKEERGCGHRAAPLPEDGTADEWLANARGCFADLGFEVAEANGDLRATVGAVDRELASRGRRKLKASQRQGRKR
ncbi:unnamed protein product [Prorocentrum cordatum]|uniref:Uncharacterized protein n=1 Tax=Prorocentrum cordatum TaxID=2364126 RepID=A0ABN9RSM9_9DINO|nr:unnamed protein product [Polarella glacialis]